MSTPPEAPSLLVAVFQAVLHASWQGSLVVVLVLLIRRAFGVRVPARWHYLLWLLVLARLLVPTASLPHNPASLENLPAVGRPFEGLTPPPVPSTVNTGPAVSVPMWPVVDSISTKAPQTRSAQPTHRPARSWWEWAAWVWLGGALGWGGWVASCAVRLHRKIARQSRPADEAIQILWQVCCRRWLGQASPRILAVDWLGSPALVGWWRPTLLVPREASAHFSEQDWEHVFAHEIAHLRWRDHRSQGLVLAAWCLHWFNPVVFLGFRRLRADRELAADEWVLKHLEGGRALAYGETLFKTVAGRPASPVFQPGLVGISEDGAQLKQRLRRIGAFLPGRRLAGSLAGLAGLLALATVVLGQGTATPKPAPTTAPAKATEEKPPAKPAPPAPQELAVLGQRFREDVLAAARTGDKAGLDALMETAWEPRGKFDKATALQMLDDALREQDLTRFTTLHDAFKKTTLGVDWKPGDERLAALVKAGRTDFLDFLLARGLELPRLSALTASADPATAGWIARRADEVRQQRADVEVLGHAARDNDLPTLRRLLEAGTDINAVDSEDNTPLIEAVFKNRLEAARLLLERGAEVDKVRYPGWNYTPLCLASSVEMAQLLKDHGANVHATLFQRPVSILTYVATWRKADLVAWFLQQGLNPKMIGDNNQTLLFGAGDAKTVKLLLDAGVDPNHIDQFDRPALCWARSGEVAQALIDGGARLTGFKYPLLTWMVNSAEGGAVDAVLRAGPKYDQAALQEALIEAAHGDNESVVKVLLQHGAKPNEPGSFSSKDDLMLPLEACSIWGGAKAAKTLLEAGADPNNNGFLKIGLLRNAMRNGHQEVAKLLRAAGARGTSDLAFALTIHDREKVKALLAAAPGYVENPAFWEGGLGAAARVGDLDAVRTALAKGAPIIVNVAPEWKEDAYEEAAGEGQDEALTLLLATRQPAANPDELRQALWDAVWNCHPYERQRSAEHFERCVQLLLDAKAPVTGYGQDPKKGPVDLMRIAVFSRYPGGNPKVMEMLARAGVDPNPLISLNDKPPTHLLEAVQKACKEGDCSMPVATTLAKLVQFAPPAPASPADAPAATPQASPAKAEEPAATPAVLGKHLSSKGHVVMADGSPLGGERIITRLYSTHGLGGSMVDTEHAEDGVFPVHLDEQTTGATLAVEQAGCAPTYLGPYDTANLEKLVDVQVKLERGYPAVVQAVDAEGHPVARARLRPYYPGPPVIEMPEIVTDAAGRATLEHLGQAPLNIRVLADGYQGDEATGLHLDPVQPYRWTLTATPPLPGVVTAEGTGQPVAGAVIKLGGVRGPHDEDHYDPKNAPVLTTADAQGHFSLNSLRADSRYYLFVENPGHGGTYLRGVGLSQGRLEVKLGPELRVRGKVVHAPASEIYQGNLHLQYSQTFHVGQNTAGSAGESANLKPANGEAAFDVGPFYRVSGEPLSTANPAPWERQIISLYVGPQRVHFSVEQLPVSDFVFDLAQPSPSPSNSSTHTNQPTNTTGESSMQKTRLSFALTCAVLVPFVSLPADDTPPAPTTKENSPVVRQLEDALHDTELLQKAGSASRGDVLAARVKLAEARIHEEQSAIVSARKEQAALTQRFADAGAATQADVTRANAALQEALLAMIKE